MITKIRLALLLGTVLACGMFYWQGYRDGRSKAEIRVIEKIVEVDKQVQADARQVASEVQAITDGQLDAKLCGFGWVRQNSGCE